MERFSPSWCARTLGTVALCSLVFGGFATCTFAQATSDVVFVSDDQADAAPKQPSDKKQASSNTLAQPGLLPRPMRRTQNPLGKAQRPKPQSASISRSTIGNIRPMSDSPEPKRKGLLTRLFSSDKQEPTTQAKSSLALRPQNSPRPTASGRPTRSQQVGQPMTRQGQQQRPSLWARITTGISGTENNPEFTQPSNQRAGRPNQSRNSLALRPPRQSTSPHRSPLAVQANATATANPSERRAVHAIAEDASTTDIRVASAEEPTSSINRRPSQANRVRPTNSRPQRSLLSMLGGGKKTPKQPGTSGAEAGTSQSLISGFKKPSSRRTATRQPQVPSSLQLQAPNRSQLTKRPRNVSRPLAMQGRNTPVKNAQTGESKRQTPPQTVSRSRELSLRPAENRTPAKLTVSEPLKTTKPAKLAGASARAASIMAEAHQASQYASSLDEYTHIIQTCRRALAIESEGEVGAYARDLAAWALNRRGQLKADQQQEVEALLDFEDGLALKPDLWRAVHNRGVILAQQGKFEQAFDDFNRTTQLNPEFAKAYSNRATLFVQAGDLAAALKDYKKAIQLDPDLAVAHKGRGRICHMLGEFADARAHYDAAAQLSPEDVHILISRADLLADIGRYTDAIQQYEQAIALDQSGRTAYRSAAWLLATCPDQRIRNGERALEFVEQCLDAEGDDDSLTLDTLAAAQASAGRFDAAIDTQQKAIAAATDDEVEAYKHRLTLYEQNESFVTQPLQPIRKVDYQQ